MADLSSVSTNFFATASETFSNNLSSSISAGATAVPVNNASAYTTGDIVVLTVEPGTSNEATFIGQKDTGNQFINCVWTEGNTGVGHSAGASVIDYTAATHQAALVKGIKKFANQDGTLITQAVRDALGLGTTAPQGWEPLGYTPSSIVDNGNRSYKFVYVGVDLTSSQSEGMRYKFVRTVPTSNTCFSLDGSNDYLVKTSPNKMTFTDDFSVSAWVYLTSYAQGVIASRTNGTSGWIWDFTNTGQIRLAGYNGALTNTRYITSYQSIPLNKWVHVSAQLDMSTYTVSTTTCYVMADGKDVPAFLTQNGTNPTALVQAGNLEIGSYNGGTAPFPGYLKDICIYNSKVTQATIADRRNQPITGAEANLASAFSGSDLLDLNRTTPNDLTAMNGAVNGFASAPWGDRGKTTNIDYGLNMKTEYVGGNTEITVQVPEGCTVPVTGGLNAVYYSYHANPYGFVTDKGRWEVRATNLTDVVQSSSVANNWYNIGSLQLNVPTGKWVLGHSVTAYRNLAGTVKVGLSTANNTAGELIFIGYIENNAGSIAGTLTKENTISISSATTFYANTSSTYGSPDLYNFGARSASVIKALPAGL